MILPLALILCFMVGCQDKAAMEELEAMKAEVKIWGQNEALAMRYYEAWESEDIEALKEILSPDFVWHTTSSQDASLEETIENLKQQHVMFPDRAVSIEDTIVMGNKVIVRFTFRGTHEGDIEGFPATGVTVESKGILKKIRSS